LTAAREFASRARALVPECEIRLFGSCARGAADAESDVDLLVEVKRPTLTPEVREQLDELAWEVGFAAGRVLQTLVYSSAELWETPRRASPLVGGIQREGILL
jgi:predicted nucleotidyltransferase